MTKIERGSRTLAALSRLRARGMTPPQIAARLATVSARTVYRWDKGDTRPQSPVYVRRLEELVREYAA